jgi:hemolysin activation/secretion protein
MSPAAIAASISPATPHDPREFEFVSGRYATPYGARRRRSRRIGLLRHQPCRRRSAQAGFYEAYLWRRGGASFALERSRWASLWLDVDLKALENVQRLRGRRFRDDTLSVLSRTPRTKDQVAGGSFRGGLTVSWGLPIGGTTHAGGPLVSRDDANARFITASFEGDWKRPVAGPFAIELAVAGQAASHPLLATAEISLGGPLFGRAYDYSERTDDQGVLGSGELQMDFGKLGASALPALRLYGQRHRS